MAPANTQTKLEVILDAQNLGAQTQVGTLTKSESRSGYGIAFEYESSWLKGKATVQPFQLDPVLTLFSGPIYSREALGKLSAAFQDCSPDRWGVKLMDRREAINANKEKRPRRALREWDYLTGVADQTRMGALRLRVPGSDRYLDDSKLDAPPTTDLRSLESIARKIDAGSDIETDEDRRWLERLIAPAGTLGGARPKANFKKPDGSLWFAKFPANDDRHDVGLWEFITSKLATAAGIIMPPAEKMKLSTLGHTFAVKRFDRENDGRKHFSSAFTLLDVNDSESSSYLDIAEVIANSGASGNVDKDLEQLFRRALFNVLIGNRDDHLRNHGFLREGNGWTISPAFDVNPNLDKDAHVLALDDSDPSPYSETLIATADSYRISKKKLPEIVNEVRGAVAPWKDVASREGASSSEIELMSVVIDPER